MNSRSAPRSNATRRIPLSPRRPRVSSGLVLILLAASIMATAALATMATAAATDSPAPTRVFAHGYHVQDDDGEGFEYAIIDPTTSSMTSSAHRDFGSLKRLGRGATSQVFWFSLDGKDYLVRDEEWVAKAKRNVAPMQELGRRQGELGAQQSAVGQQQSKLGECIEALRAKQEPLADRQRELGRRQAALGQQQRQASSIASQALEKLARDAVKSGKADPIGN